MQSKGRLLEKIDGVRRTAILRREVVGCHIRSERNAWCQCPADAASSGPPPAININRHLLFGALAFQNEYIDLAQFGAVCRTWAADKTRPLADLLVERGWITVAVRAVLDEIVERKLKRYGGDPHATLG